MCLIDEGASELYVSTVITLVSMSPDEVRRWLDESLEVFASELSEASGMDLDEAMLKAKSILSEVVPDGADTVGQSFRWIVNGTDRVGRVWFGPVPDRERIVHIWDIEMYPAFRGQGFGGSAIDSVVEEARGMAATALTLNVFETNPDAERLYEGKGFVVGHTTSGQVEMTLKLS